VDTRNSKITYTGHTIPMLRPEELFCEECSADFTVKHDMGTTYIAHFCTFCGNEIIHEEQLIDYEEPDNE
jgi:hypothetical protein